MPNGVPAAPPLHGLRGLFARSSAGEYVREVYWLRMPGYVAQNTVGSGRPLPSFYWSGLTNMLCLPQVIGQTIQTGYAHYIQRLMITGTYALLIGAGLAQVHLWYLSIYAYEWGELPNTLGMSQFADGVYLASKPSAASANYINKMSIFSRGCAFVPKARSGPRACPWNAPYGDSIARHADICAKNSCMALPLRHWHNLPKAEQAALRTGAAAHLYDLHLGPEWQD